MCLIQKFNATIVYILYSLFLICIYSFLRKRNAHGMFADKRAEIPNKKKKNMLKNCLYVFSLMR